MTEKSRLMVVDDHPLFRRGLVSLLSYDQRFHVVCEAGDVSEALRLVRSMSVELVLLDNHLPGVRGVDAIASFKELDPTLKVVMLTVSEDEDDLAKALKSGADGYLLKTADSEQLSETLHRIMEGESVISPQMIISSWPRSGIRVARPANKVIAQKLNAYLRANMRLFC